MGTLICIGVFDAEALQEHQARVKPESRVGWRVLFAPSQIPTCVGRGDLRLTIRGYDPRIEARYAEVWLELHHIAHVEPVWRYCATNLELRGLPKILWADEFE